MPNTLILKTKDICEALAIGRHQLRTWTNVLPPYAKQQTKERSARWYEPVDLLFFAVVKHLDEKFGLSVQCIECFSNDLYRCLKEPYSLTSQSFLFINNADSSCKKLSLDKITGEGIIVDLLPAQMLVCQFLGVSMAQTSLQLSLGSVDISTKPNQSGSKIQKAQKALREFIKPREDTPKVFEFVDQTCH